MVELVQMLVQMGMTETTARAAAEEIHQDENQALNLHMVTELGIDPREKPSPRLAALSSFVLFAVGAVIPLLPYLLGFSSLVAGLVCGGVGLLVAGGVAARYTGKSIWWASARQLTLGAIAIAATYVVGLLIGSAV